MDRFDYVVIGAGPGGYVSAIRAAQLGLKCALIEKERALGGTCLNVGCIPSKVLLESSEHFAMAQNGLQNHGIRVKGLEFDLAAMMARKDAIVAEITGGISLLMKKNKIKVIRGRGVLTGPGSVRIEGGKEDREIRGEHVVLAMGSVPVELPGLPFDGERIVSSTEALAFLEVPRRLLVVGAGAIGLELGSVWRRLGAEVTVAEILPRAAPFADPQLSKLLERALIRQGIRFRMNCKVAAAEKTRDGIEASLENPEKQVEKIPCDKVLVAVGRKPCLEGAGIREAGVALDERGRVRVDEQWRTNLPGVYALGDLIHGPMLAHKAEEEGVAIAERAAGLAGHVNYESVPNVIYTDPELAQAGLTEEEARAKGIPCKTGRSYFKANGRARSLDAEEGMVKIVAHESTDRILGVHILGPRASELIAEAVAVLEFGGSAEDVARTCHAHPTLSEVVKEAALAVDKRSLHG